REVLITGHLDHPKWSANDNASGSGAMMEAARVLQTLIATKKLAAPKLTLHFMWVPEYFGTLAYVTNHPETRPCGNFYETPNNGPQCVLANINMDMVGEDTVKTNSRFYFTRTPDSVPFFINAVLSDVLQQTREADLYAQTGTRNYWQPEGIPYVQGSDHDVFLGLGIPATMLGHDPDWTHHTSEDRIDKTDASEFRRVGAFASAAAWFMATADAQSWKRVRVGAYADRVAELAHRLGQDSASDAAVKRVLKNRGEFSAQSDRLESLTPQAGPARASAQTSAAAQNGPQRQTILPLDASVFENVTPDEKKWLAEQEARFASDSEGLPTSPNFALISFEALNFMNGRTSTAEIADLLSAEYLVDIDQAWVDRLVSILEKQKLVAK
ncbi:MAG TPA: M28 family peptidase, partial [Candidatus Sulfotelmatobacter sp.]|nr:M28 family peptidase [Candidatus Sulfotelmatobacter sp.]